MLLIFLTFLYVFTYFLSTFSLKSVLLHTPVIYLRRHVTYDNHTQQVLADFPLLPLNLTEILHLKKIEQETTQQRLKTEYAIYAHMQVKKQPLYFIKIMFSQM